MHDAELHNLLDEARIARLLMRYADALDARDWAALDAVFAADASARYQGIGDFHGRDAIVAVVRDALAACGPTQHLLGNIRIEVDGDRASARCYLQAIHAGLGARAASTLSVWGEYRDRLARGPEGWRIVHRELALCHIAGDIGDTALAATHNDPAPVGA